MSIHEFRNQFDHHVGMAFHYNEQAEVYPHALTKKDYARKASEESAIAREVDIIFYQTLKKSNPKKYAVMVEGLKEVGISLK